MIIECPACHTRSKLPDSKEGAKVRCGECSRVFVARPPGAGRARSSSGPSTGVMIGGAAVVVLVVLGLILSQLDHSKEPQTTAPETADTGPAEPSVVIATRGWEAPPVQFAARLHEMAHAGNADGIKALLDGAALWSWDQARTTAAAESAVAAGDEDVPVPDEREWATLTGAERIDQLDAWSRELAESEPGQWIRDWKPYDGDVLRDELDDVLVEVYLTPRAGGVEKRVVKWELTPESSTFRVAGWERVLTKDELRAELDRKRGYERKVLSTGRKVTERDPEPLPHLETTSPELRARIDELIVSVNDLDAGLAGTRAARELVEIGKPAIPILLTQLYEMGTGFTDDATSVRANLIVSTLRSITGKYFGYDPMVDPDGVFGTTAELRDSSIRQWFAWWHRYGGRFEGPEAPK